MHTTSPSLLDRLAQGADDSAWCRFVALYTPLLLAWCRRAGLSDADAADLVQGVFVILLEKLPQFRYDPQQSFRAWLRTVLLNAWRNLLRKQQAERTSLAAAIDPDQIPDTDPRVDLDETEYRTHLVQRALALMQSQFEPNTWKACWEFVVHDRPADEVAAELGLSVNAVYLAKSRVLRQLRQELHWFLD